MFCTYINQLKDNLFISYNKARTNQQTNPIISKIHTMPIISTKYFDYDPEEIEAIFPVSSMPKYTGEQLRDIAIENHMEFDLLPSPPSHWILNMPEMIKDIDCIMPEYFSYDENKTIDCNTEALPPVENKLIAKLQSKHEDYKHFEMMREQLIKNRNQSSQYETNKEYIESLGYNTKRIVKYDNSLFYIIDESARKILIQPFKVYRSTKTIMSRINPRNPGYVWSSVTIPVVDSTAKTISIYKSHANYDTEDSAFIAWNFSSNYSEHLRFNY